MKDPSCIFCKIIDGQIPCAKVTETDRVLAFLDISPINPGHVLVVPKEHHMNVLDTPDELLAACVAMCKSLARAVKEELPCDGVNIGMNNFAAAGQVVMHAHMHVIPRFEHDGLRHWPGKPYQQGQADQIAKRLTSAMQRRS